MALNDFLLDILVCPSTKQRVALAPSEVVVRINQGIAGGALHDMGGALVEKEVDALLVRDDGAIAYPVRGEIPEMLVERGILLEAFE